MNCNANNCEPKESTKPSGSSGDTQIVTWGVLLAMSIAAFGLRVLNWHAIFRSDTVRFLDGDAFYHMRRIFLAVQNNMSVPIFDPYLNFPAGLHTIWVPLFDQVVAGAALLVGMGHPSPHLIETIGALAPPVLGALTVPIVFFIARFFLSEWPAMLAASIFAILPYNIQVSVLGRPDHHPAVVLESCLLLLSLLRLSRRNGAPGVFSWSIISGFLLFLMLDLWSGGSLLFVMILACYFPLSILANYRDGRTANMTTLGGCAVFLSAALFLWPLAAHTYWNTNGITNWSVLSTFQVLLLAICAGGVLGAGFIAQMLRNRHQAGNWKVSCRPALMLLVLGALISASLLTNRSFLEQITGPSKWLVKEDRFLRHVVENLPLTWQSAGEDFTWLVLLFPFLLALLIHGAWKRGLRNAAVLLLVWTLAIGASTLMQERFADLFSVVAAILIAYFAALFLDSDHPYHIPTFLSNKCAPLVNGVVIPALCLCVIVFSAWPTLRWLSFYKRSAISHHAGLDILYEMGRWFRDNTPPTQGYDDLSGKPAYGILATWSYGHAIMYISHRPVVACNFGGIAENAEANLAPYRFFTETDPDEAEKILATHSVRYVVVEETLVTGHFARMIDILGLRHADFFATGGKDGHPIYMPKQQFLDAMTSRLYLSGTNRVEHFTLVYESSRKMSVAGKPTSVFRVFEYDPARQTRYPN